jgi:NADH-quinone oxidoreductase subunit L
MENYAPLVTLVIVFPLIGMVINLFLGRYMGEKLIGAVASIAAGLAFAVAVILTIAHANYGYEPVVVNAPFLESWITIPSAAIQIPFQFRVDSLSLTMMLVVTGVGTLIHIYGVGYMHGDARFPRFFVYMNMFLVFMLLLVIGNNFLLMFVGWEGVGLCSFLLIGFWFDKKRGEGWRNSNAARKAFIVNRVGDFGLLMAIFLIFWTFGTLDYYKPGEVLHVAAAGAHEGESEPKAAEGETHQEGEAGGEEHGEAAVAGPKGVFPQAYEWLQQGGHIVHFGPFELPFETVVTLTTLFMLLGVTGKSAQIPLFVWLPDAMAGPTPVSALIHAATMVTAGIYLVTRCSVLYTAAPLSSAIVTIVGATTALVGGFIALGQWDIKRVLAYSTISQLGFMVAAVGLGGYAAGMFHLVTHAFFKALLFLGSGSVIHAVEHGHHLAHAAHGNGHGASHGDGHADAHGAGHEEHPEEEGEPFDPQDMRNMGGLARKLPVTFATYLIGTLALAGIFPLSGFWSKDEILGKAFNVGFNNGKVEGYIALVLLLVAAGFTAFYMWRQIRLVFLGAPRTDAAVNAPESSSLLTTPLVILAVLATVGGLLNIPLGVNLLGWPLEVLTLWLEHSVPYTTGLAFNLPLALTALIIAIVAILLANRVYSPSPLTKKGRDKLEARAQTRQLFRVANARLYWDEFYGRFIEQPFNRASQWLAFKLDWEFWHDGFHNRVLRDGYNSLTQFMSRDVDRNAIDAGFMNIGKLIVNLAGRLRNIQTGYLRTYVFTMLFGVLLVVIIILFPLIRQLVGQ